MVDQSPHIIAKVAWDTKCSDKALAVSLQNEISHWTKTRMASEITQVLDNLCPADQVWKIESLELDLGTIDYADLTGTLSNRFSHTLTDQLRSLLFYTIRDKAKIKVTKIADSNLLLLKNYLEKGYLPWWQKQQITSVKNIFENLFKNDRQSLMQMIRAVGRSHHVRTRLAQQFEDGILQKIIAELEPYHSKDIFSLLNGLVKVQSRERIVSSSTSHFRKNVWSWVFTHLLVEQDRHFNDVAFVKSLLNQMATQFHLDYHGLVLQVSTLPKTRKSKKHVHPGLITAVDQLLEGRSVSPLKTEESENWQLLNQYFDTSSVEKVSVQHMSELLTTLSDKEPHKMRAWLSQLKKNTKKWVRLSDSLDERTFSSVLSSIYSKDAQLLIHGLRLLKKVIKEDNWSNNKKLIWRLGLDYAMHSNQSKNQQSLVEFFINTMAENENIAVEGIFDGFRRSNVWSMPKTKHSLNLFEDLQATQQNKNGVFNSEVFSQRIRIELDRIRKANYRAEVAFEEYQQLSRWVIRHTKLTSETLKEYFDTVVLPKKFLENLSSPALEALLNQVAKQHKGIISEFEAQWEKMMQENQTIGSFPLTLFTIRSSSIRILIKDRFVSNEAFIKALINELTHFMSIAELTIFQRFIHESLVNGDKTAFNFSTVEVSQIKKLIDEKTTEDFLIKTHVLISQGSSDHDVVSAFLLSNYEHPDFVNARNAESEDLSLILNYFIQDGTRLKKIWTQKALETLKTEVKNLGTARVSYDLRELFWKCALFYKDHWGDATLLKGFSFDSCFYDSHFAR
ncbi:MAG: contractile injection system tape measure protein [Bacteroidota bacterium]